jgi:hypothetical protein
MWFVRKHTHARSSARDVTPAVRIFKTYGADAIPLVPIIPIGWLPISRALASNRRSYRRAAQDPNGHCGVAEDGCSLKRRNSWNFLPPSSPKRCKRNWLPASWLVDLTAEHQRMEVFGTGGPGPGKTTLVNSILKILCAKSVALRCVRQAGARPRAWPRGPEWKPAKTNHRLLKVDPRSGGFKTLRDQSVRMLAVGRGRSVDGGRAADGVALEDVAAARRTAAR